MQCCVLLSALLALVQSATFLISQISYVTDTDFMQCLIQETKTSCFAAVLLWNSSPVIPVQTTCIIHIKQDLDGKKASKEPDKQQQPQCTKKTKFQNTNPHGKGEIKASRCPYGTIISLSQEASLKHRPVTLPQRRPLFVGSDLMERTFLYNKILWD